jgi:hypothetical protein
MWGLCHVLARSCVLVRADAVLQLLSVSVPDGQLLLPEEVK